MLAIDRTANEEAPMPLDRAPTGDCALALVATLAEKCSKLYRRAIYPGPFITKEDVKEDIETYTKKT